MKRSKFGKLLGTLFLTSLLLFGLTGAGYAEKEFNIGILPHLTGPYGPGTRGILEGAMDSVEAVNQYE